MFTTANLAKLPADKQIVSYCYSRPDRQPGHRRAAACWATTPTTCSSAWPPGRSSTTMSTPVWDVSKSLEPAARGRAPIAEAAAAAATAAPGPRHRADHRRGVRRACSWLAWPAPGARPGAAPPLVDSRPIDHEPGLVGRARAPGAERRVLIIPSEEPDVPSLRAHGRGQAASSASWCSPACAPGSLRRWRRTGARPSRRRTVAQAATRAARSDRTARNRYHRRPQPLSLPRPWRRLEHPSRRQPQCADRSPDRGARRSATADASNCVTCHTSEETLQKLAVERGACGETLRRRRLRGRCASGGGMAKGVRRRRRSSWTATRTRRRRTASSATAARAARTTWRRPTRASSLTPLRHKEATEKLCGACHTEIATAQVKSLHFDSHGYDTIIGQRLGDAPESHKAWEEAEANHCSSCHTTCGQCHVSQPTSVGGGLISGHQFKATQAFTRTCTGCHGSRINAEYTGQNEGHPRGRPLDARPAWPASSATQATRCTA